MKRFVAALAVLGCALFITPDAAQAQAQAQTQENPKPLQGIWSSPDCAKAESLWIMSRYFFLRYQQGMASIDSAAAWDAVSDEGEMLYALRPVKGRPVLLSRSNDGLIQVIETADPAGPDLVQSWRAAQSDPSSEPSREYSHCAKLFDSAPSLGQSEVNTVFLLDQAMEECGKVRPDDFAAARSCQAGLFTLFDGDRDQALDRAELTHLYRQVQFLKHSHACQPDGTTEMGASRTNSTAGPDKAATHFADHLWRANGNKPVRLSDLPALRRTEKNHPLWRGFMDDVQTLHGLIGFIPAAANPAPSCTGTGNGAFLSKDSVQPLQIQWNAPRHEITDPGVE